MTLVVLLSGAAWGLSFRYHAGGVMPWLALAPFILVTLDPATGRRAAFLLGWGHGTVAWLVSVYWISPVMVDYGGLPGPAGPALLLLLALYLGSYHAVFGLLAAAMRSRTGWGWRALLWLPGLWLLLEWVRGFLFTGFPWNLAGYAIEVVPGALSTAAFLGASGLGWLVLVVNTAFALVLSRWLVGRGRVAPVETTRGAKPLGPGGLAVVAGGVVAVLLVGSLLPTGVKEQGEPIAVRLIQPNIPILTEYDGRVAYENYLSLLELAEGACTAQRPLVVFPESALWPYSWQNDARVRADLERVAAPDCAVLVNTATWTDEETVYNSAALVAGSRLLGRYDKNHLVPWGEYVPLGDLIPFVDRLARAAGDFSAAEEATLLEWRGQRFGVSICFEVIFADEVADRVRRGATVLVTMTNDAWYGDTSAPWQHLRAARFRAAETGRPLLRAAITGVSAVFDGRGRPVASLGVGERGVIDVEIQPTSGSTPFVRAPWLVLVVAVGAALFAVSWRS